MVGHDALRTFYQQVGSLPAKAELLRLAVNGIEAAMMFEVSIYSEAMAIPRWSR